MKAATLTTASLPAHLRGNPAFEAAIHHSQIVRWLRRSIPVLSCLVLAFLITKTLWGVLMPGIPAVSGTISIAGRKIVMENPKLSGFKRDGSTYELTAARAVQDLKAPNIVEMERIIARVQTGQAGWTNITGAEGTYDSKAERIDLRGGVKIKTDNGTEADLVDAKVEFKAGHVVSEKPVQVRIPQGNIKADGLQVLDNGRKLVFEGNVQSLFSNPDAGKPSPSPAGQEPANQ